MINNPKLGPLGKLASTIELGRIYGLQAQKYDMILKRQLNQDKPETQEMW